MSPAHSVLAVLAALAATALPAHAERVAVVPFAPLSGEVPAPASRGVASRLVEQLRSVGLEVVEFPAASTDPAVLAKARAALEDTKDRAGARFRTSVAEMRELVAFFERHAAEVSAVELSDAHVALAIALYMDAQDVEGEGELQRAIALTPARHFDGEESSLLFEAMVDRARDQLLARGAGTLVIDSAPRGAPVFLDDQPVGRTPFTVKALTAGEHQWRVALSASEPAGGTVLLAPNESRTVTANLRGAGPTTVLNRLLVANRIDRAALDAAHEVARASGADLVAFGVLQARDADLTAETFLYSAATGRVIRLARKQFDAELVGAGPAMLALATEMSGPAAGARPVALSETALEGAAPPEAFAAASCQYVMPSRAAPPIPDDVKRHVLNPMAQEGLVSIYDRKQVEQSRPQDGPRVPLSGRSMGNLSTRFRPRDGQPAPAPADAAEGSAVPICGARRTE